MILDIFDASALVHSGNGSEMYRSESYYNYPIGGIHYFFKFLAPSLVAGHKVVVAFDSRSFRKDLDLKYKSNRTVKKAVRSQLETLYDGLMASNIACYKVDTYEADDIINWAVNKYKHSSDYNEIIIYGNDYDLCHNIDYKVRFRGITSNVNSIYYGNFTKSIKHGETIMFNTLAAYKVFCGDTSDCIQPFKHEAGLKPKELYDKYVDFLNKYQDDNDVRFSIDYLISIAPIAVFINTSNLFTEAEKQQLYNRIKLVYPAECPNDVDIVPSGLRDVNNSELCRFLNMYGDRYALSCFEYKKSKPIQSDIEIIKNKAHQLLSGEYEVDRNLPLETNYSEYEDDALFLREF